MATSSATALTGISASIAISRGLKQQREAAFESRPSKRDSAHPVARAADPGYAGVQVRLVLEEVQVPPGLVAAVMHRKGGGVALWAGKARPLGEIQVQVQALAIGAELGGSGRPRAAWNRFSAIDSLPTIQGRTRTLPGSRPLATGTRSWPRNRRKRHP